MTRKKRKKKLKVAHVVIATPQQCGMYESARELVIAERRQGINAHIVDIRPTEKEVKGKKRRKLQEIKCPKCNEKSKIVLEEKDIPHRPSPWAEDRGVCVAPIDFAMNSDVIVSHSGLDERFKDTRMPKIHVAHGRPNSSYRIERGGETPIYTMYKQMSKDPTWKYMVTLWPGYEHYWRLVFPNIKVIPAFVDLEYWRPMEVDYKFDNWVDMKAKKVVKGKSQSGTPNVICADIWRMDKDPFHLINAFALFAEKYPEAKLHIYGMDDNGRGRDAILTCLRERGVLGETMPMVKNLREIYNTGDILITPQSIATRTVRESLACGINVVADRLNPYTDYRADIEDIQTYANEIERAWTDWQEDRIGCKQRNRETAEREFDVSRAAKQFVELLKEITGKAAKAA